MTDRRVEQFLQDNSELNYIDKDVFEGCFYKIQSWIDIQVLLPYLMRYHLVTSDDRDYLTNPYKTAVDKSFHLVAVAEKGGRHGYMLLYICILESAKETQGHVDAVKELDEMASMQKKSTDKEAPKTGEVSTTVSKNPHAERRKYSISREEVQKGILKLEDSFSDIASSLLVELDDQKFDVRYIKSRITVLPPSINRDVFLSLERAVNKLGSCSGTLESLFSYLNANVWNFIDYHLLEYIVSRFGSQDVMAKMSHYIYRLQIFQQNTTVYDFIEEWPGHQLKPNDYVDFEVKFKPDYPRDFTLERLNHFRQEIRRKFLPPLSECAMIHYKHRYGCFVVTWILPAHLASMIEQGVKQLQSYDLFESYFVDYLSVQSKVLYQSEESDHFTRGILERIKHDYSSFPSLVESSLDGTEADGNGSASHTHASPGIEVLTQTFNPAMIRGASVGSSTSSSEPDSPPESELEQSQERELSRSPSATLDNPELQHKLIMLRLQTSDPLFKVSFQKRPRRDRKYDKGRYPSISINNNNTVVEVCHQMATNWMLYRVGEVKDRLVLWAPPLSESKPKKAHFGSGAYPKISINDRNMIVEVHRGQYLEKSFYRVGIIYPELRKIEWFTSTFFAMGHYPDVAINNFNVVVAIVRRDVFSKLLHYRVGKISEMKEGEIVWVGTRHKLNMAENFSLDINNDNTVVLAYQTLLHHVHYKVGKIDFFSGEILWGEPIHVYKGGITPCISINDNNHVVLTLQSIMGRKLICNVGVAHWERSFGWISWPDKKSELNQKYEKGWFPSVGVNNCGQVVEAHEPRFAVAPRGHLHYYVGKLEQ